ncbi:3-hydroxyisobutyrate dehydrogenase [Vibrio sp. Of7-15]|uniref:3-hydroxyisobutyrate dehydrogenase n=1 Tax=Vibrio sp. Of7-15 TaxID=2724879 RepID=UPI001EF2001A|nr:3-hydroxyisobutyrate dehydrogenase [Vibrio sp. Of7-15]MCG7496235.1 3-hydroxyisobutyrate dehydrogenase [Vibrio sp. Of7-15]
METVAFIGLGNMGAPMAINLLKAGYQVNVFDLNPKAIEKVAEHGAIACSDLTSVVDKVSIVLTMLPAGQHVRQVYLDNDDGPGVFSLIDDKTFIIDSSTIDPATAKQMAHEACKRGIGFVDAPVSGGVAGAAAGTLTFIVGGSEGDFSQAKPILEVMGKNVFHAGEAGAGQLAKICNNIMLATLMVGTCEALNLGIDHGLDPKVLTNIMLQSSGKNWALEVYNPCPGIMENVPSSNDYRGGFMGKLMVKDLGLAMEAAIQSQSSIPMGTLARNLYAIHNSNGNEERDFSSLFEFFSHK